MKAIHKAVGSYTLCGRFLRDTMIAGDVPTCKYCIAGGVGPHKKVVAILKESTPSSAEEILDKVCQEWYNNINTILSQFKKGDQTEQRFTIEDMREAFEAGVACEATGETQFDEWIKTRKK